MKRERRKSLTKLVLRMASKVIVVREEFKLTNNTNMGFKVEQKCKIMKNPNRVESLFLRIKPKICLSKQGKNRLVSIL